MGRKLDALLRRGFKTAKFKATVALAISRLTVLKNQPQARCSIARSDVVEFLKINNHDRALLRVEQVIKEQNMLDVLALVEGYCHFLQERVHLIEQEKICPEELHEALSSLIYASTRCGEFPELQEIRAIFTSRYGREFAARAVELRNNCGVNPQVIQKLSIRKPSLESKMKMLKDIASDNNIDLPIEYTEPDTTTMEHKGQPGPDEKYIPGPSGQSGFLAHQEESITTIHPDEIDRSVRRKYKDVADAAQAAFESAAYAAAAARAAVELSRSESNDSPGGPYTPRKPKFQLEAREKYSSDEEEMKNEMKFEKTHPDQNYDSEVEKGVERLEANVDVVITESSDSFDDHVKGFGDKDGGVKQKEIAFDESDDSEKDSKRVEITEPLNIGRRPISVRTRRAR